MTVEGKLAQVLGDIPALGGRVFPVGVVADEEQSPLAVYRFTGYAMDRDLSGAIVFHHDRVQIDIWGSSYDEVSDIQHQAERALSALVQVDLGDGRWLHGVELGGNASDAVDTVRDEVRRCIVCTLTWSD